MYSVMYLNQDGDEKEMVFNQQEQAINAAKDASRAYGIAQIVYPESYDLYQNGEYVKRVQENY